MCDGVAAFGAERKLMSVLGGFRFCRFPVIQACWSWRLAEVTAAFRDGSSAAQGETRRVQC